MARTQNDTTNVTPYAAASIVNKVLEDAGIDKQVPPQMMYNYTTARIRKGQRPLIDTVEVNGKVMIPTDKLTEWLEKYVAKQQAGAES